MSSERSEQGGSRRRNLRAQVKLPVLLISEDDARREQIAGETADLSVGGAAVISDRYMPLRARLVLGLYLEEGPVVVDARIAHRARDEDGRWRYGIRFCSWPGQARFQLTREVLRALAAGRTGPPGGPSSLAA
jgi:hypothetical protein